MVILEINEVAKSHTQNNQVLQVLSATNLKVAENDFITILGPSGCGKSTLLRMIAGLDTLTSGEIKLDGHPVLQPGADRGMVFQSYTLFPWLNVLQNVCFGLHEKKMNQAEEFAKEYLNKVGLAAFAHFYPYQLSGGMQQRVALARALVNHPRILLMDEPFGALDHQTREYMQEMLHDIWQHDRKTVLFVTHDIDEAIFMGTRVVVLSARPAKIKCDQEISFSYPRHYSIKTTPQFSELKAFLTEQIRHEIQTS